MSNVSTGTASRTLLASVLMLCAACANLGGPAAEGEDPALAWEEPAPATGPGSEAAASPDGTEGEEEVAIAVAESYAEFGRLGVIPVGLTAEEAETVGRRLREVLSGT